VAGGGFNSPLLFAPKAASDAIAGIIVKSTQLFIGSDDGYFYAFPAQ
jgi:hypothetical protein